MLRNRQYLRLWLGQVVSLLGDQFAYMGLSFLILYRLGGTAVDVGKMLIAASLPALLFGPVAGVFVDRWSRRKLMILADLVRAAIYFAMPLAHTLPAVYLGIFCANTMSRFFAPARSALVPQVVSDDELVPALAFGQTSASLVLMIGPALGGVLAARLGITLALHANAVSFLFSALLILGVRVHEDHAGEHHGVAVARADHATPAELAATASIGGAASGRTRTITALWRDLRLAWRFIGRNRAVRFISIMYGLFVFLAEGLNVLFISFLKDGVGLGVGAIGTLEIAQAVGGAAGAVVMLFLAARHSPRLLYFVGIVGMGVVLAVTAHARSLALLVPLFAAIGVMLAVVSVPHDIEMVRLVPARLRGRVFGSVNSITDACAMLSAGLLPGLAAAGGVTPVMVGIGLAVIAIGAVGLVISERMMHQHPTVADGGWHQG